MELTHHVYQHKVEIDEKPITNQNSSGRCWIFACLNIICIPFIKHLTWKSLNVVNLIYSSITKS